MMIFKKITAIFIIIAMIFSCLGCSDNNSSAIIYYGVNEPPVNIDPQCASTVTELMLVKNLYEGLMREDSNGKIVNGIVETYEKDGDRFTFKIREDALWSDGTQLTAYDFEFGITRALSPTTNSPYADSLYGIKNAEAVHKGNAEVSSLGIKVLDQYTLVIDTEPDTDILYALSTAPAMPCNQEFFEDSIGRYGMSVNTVLCNGSYKLKKWSLEDFAMRIVKNDKYTGNFIPKNAAVYLSKNKDYTNLECLEKNYVDIAEIPTTDYAKAQNKGYNLTTLENKVLIIGIGNSYSKEMRSALFSSLLTPDDFKNFNPSYSFADRLFPRFFNYNDTSVNLYNPQNSKFTFNTEIKKLPDKDFPCDKIYYFGDGDIADIVKSIAGHLQQNLGVYINIAPAKNNAEAKSYAENSYGIGVYSVEINQANSGRYLENFDIKNSNNTSKNLQTEVFKNSYSIPICFFGTCFAYSDKLSDIEITSIGGCIDFSRISKKD